MTELSDIDLVRLAQRGDQKAYQVLIKRYYNKINQMIYYSIQDRHIVNDLTQEVFLKIIRFIHHYKEESHFYTWVYRITQNTIKNYFRSLQNQANYELDLNYCRETHHSPEMNIINMELNEHLERNLDKLSLELRESLAMFQFEGKSYEVIAKEMACPVGTVRSRIFRARKILMDSIRLKH